MGDIIGNAPQEPPLALHALVANDDDVGTDLAGDRQDRLGGIAWTCMGGELLSTGERHEGVETALRFEASRRILALNRATVFRVRGNEMDVSIQRLGEVDRLGERPSARLGLMGAHHYHLEHNFPLAAL